jgi:voltage-gated potassium channel
MPALASHVHKTAQARLADSGDLAAAEIAQATAEQQQLDR